MFVRKKRNKSGTISVHIIRKKKDGSQEVVQTFGTAREDEPEKLKLMVSQARAFIKKDDVRQLKLPFPYGRDELATSFFSAIKNTDIQVAGPEMIFGRLYDKIGYNAIKSEMFRHLVICRLFNPGSKLKTVEYLERYLHVTYSIDSIYRFLDELCSRKKDGGDSTSDYKGEVEKITFEHTKRH